jgi:Flp pilus assembly protein TadD
MQRIALLLVAMLSCGCAVVPPADPKALFADALFDPPAETLRPQEIFALSPAMKRFAATTLRERVQRDGLREGLFNAIKHELTLDYDAARTRTAAEAFEARSGNCLSLVLLTAAFARHLDIPIEYQAVYGVETWSRDKGIAFLNGHVNLLLGWGGDGPDPHARRDLIVDFVPEFQNRDFLVRRIAEATVIAMFLNNRAAELLSIGDLRAAYWWARAALHTWPISVSAHNTLAVVYMRRGALPQAERVLRAALAREPDNPQVLSNLALMLARAGRQEEERVVRRRLAEIAPHPPFYFLDQGIAALARGDIAQAMALFKKEQRRAPHDAELHFAMALADLKLGNHRAARRHLGIAVENSITRERSAIYAAKLRHLESISTN